jgi:predicted amidophosphoribosyltransferase
MEGLPSTTVWLIILACLCLLLVWLRWRLTHPRCISCRKPSRRAFAYCPWCGLQRFDTRRYRASARQKIPRYQRASLAAPGTMPHKHAHTIVLPERSQSQRMPGLEYGTILVPEPSVQPRQRFRKRSRGQSLPTHVPTCIQCKTVLDADDTRCWYCGSTMIVGVERKYL